MPPARRDLEPPLRRVVWSRATRIIASRYPPINLYERVSPDPAVWDADDNWFGRWDWVMGELIWAFSRVNEDLENDMREMTWNNKRMENNFRLFGKYYLNLWD